MENYQYLNQKMELSSNPNKINSPFNKNIQIQNYFRGESNQSKQKNKMYNINNKKEIHFSSRPRENELKINGPKILTNNFPPEFMVSSDNSRKNSSHEKNLYLQKNMANNMELNYIDKVNNKKFANTSKNEFEKLNGVNSQNNINKTKHIILINLNKKENKTKLRKNNLFNLKKSEVESSSRVSISSPNRGYMHSETEINLRKKYPHNRNDLQKEKENGNNYNISNNHIRTETSENDRLKYLTTGATVQNNYKTDSNTYLDKPFSFHIYSQQNIKKTLNKDNCKQVYNNNKSNNSDNSKDKILNNYLKNQKNIFIIGNSNNKLVFNPSSINPRMKKINSESEYNTLYLASKNKGISSNNQIKYYNHINELYNNNGIYNQFKLESLSKLSSSPGENSNSPSKEKNHIKTQTDFDNRPNYYESIINELDNKKNRGQKSNLNVKSAVEYNKSILDNLSIKKKLENINIGIAYKLYNGYKFYFNLPNEQIYILKEVSYSCGKGLIPQIESWNKKYQNDSIYLKIYDHEINFNQRQIIWVIQYPTGGESINDIINSVGFYDQNYLFDLVTKIHKSIIKVKEDKDNLNYKNVPFCICDVFINVNEHIKIIPPLIRQIPIDSNLDKKNNINKKSNTHISSCKCKINLKKILTYIKEDSYSFFCLGFAIIQTITQNLIFDMTSYKYTLNTLKKSKKNIFKEQCCFVHLLLNIEKTYFNDSKYLLFSNFLNLYPKSLLSLLHECTNFNNNIVSSSNEFLNLYDTNKNLNLSIKEVLDITTIPENDYIKFDTFLSKFEKLFKGIKTNPEIYLRKLNSNKVIHVLSRSFGLDKEIFRNRLKEKIVRNLNELNIEDNNEKYNIKDKENENSDYEKENGNKYNLNNDNISSLFIGFNKKKKEINENLFKKQNHSHLIHNYIYSSESNDYK